MKYMIQEIVNITIFERRFITVISNYTATLPHRQGTRQQSTHMGVIHFLVKYGHSRTIDANRTEE